MDESRLDPNQPNYFRINSPEKVSVDKEDIYYRKKHDEIVSYLKAVFTDIEELMKLNYNRFINPRGCILITVHPGNDIEDFLRFLSNNYQLNLIELNYAEIIKNPNNFFEDFIELINDLVNKSSYKNISTRESGQNSETNRNTSNFGRNPLTRENYTLFVVNENNLPANLIRENYLLTRFIDHFQNSYQFIENRFILTWITKFNNEIAENHNKIYRIFDLLINLPRLSKLEREELFRSVSEQNPKIVFDINILTEKTEDWEVEDIRQLLKVGIFKQFLNSELNEASNEITDVLVELIEQGEFISSRDLLENLNQKRGYKIDKNFEEDNGTHSRYRESHQINQKFIEEYIETIRNENISEFMLEQLYENAASKHYTELNIIIDKLNSNEKLGENDKYLLGKYPFLLRVKPKMAQIYLEKAKKRIDQLKRIFGENL